MSNWKYVNPEKTVVGRDTIDSKGIPGYECCLLSVIELAEGETIEDYVEPFRTYAQQREMAYPSIVDQLDTLYHGGYDGWKATIDAIKNTYPKV